MTGRARNFLLFFFLLNAWGAFAQEELPKSVRIGSIQTSGPGCPAGSSAHLLTEQGELVSLIFDEFYLERSGSDDKSAQTHCAVTLALELSPGWTYALLYTGLEGYAFLENSVRAMQNFTFQFNTANQVSKAEAVRLNGPYDGAFTRQDAVPLSQLKFAPCGQPSTLTINTTLGLKSAQNGYGYVSVDTLAGKLVHDFGMVFKPCQGAGQLSHLAVCSVEVQHKNKKEGQIVIQGKGKSAVQAQNRAQKKIKQRCDPKKKKKPGLVCVESTLSCQSLTL